MNGRFQKFTMFFLFLSLFFSLLGGDVQNPVSANTGKKEKAIKVLEISGAIQTYVDALLEGIKKMPLPFEDKELYAKFATSDSIMDHFIPVYMERYTDEELDAMISFYSSPAGQSIVKKSLLVVIELRKAGAQWGIQVSARVNLEKARIATGKDK